MGMKTIWYAIKQPVSFPDNNNFSGNNLAAFQKGLFTSFSNPKTAAFFVGLFISTFPTQAPLCGSQKAHLLKSPLSGPCHIVS
jgi:threonine/homoserine/homoserine lactone efflux protein